MMKEYGIAFVMTQSMFCALPFPCHLWKEEARNKMLLFLPVVGLEIGLLWTLLDWGLGYLNVPGLVCGLAMCAFPYLLTGFIHLDGFLDVTDAICSWRDLEQRRKILKDSHVGSFAVIWCVFLLLAGFAFLASVPAEAQSGILIFVPMISRCCSALAVSSLKPMGSSQYAGSQSSTPKWHNILLAALEIGCVAAGFLLFGKYGLVLVGGLLGYGVALLRSYRSLEGMNGDISGYCLTISELCAVAVYALL
ncbi:MAG: adenosylcobinamide-GDP ribazoletransferase [Lachnospiraceae bacterium]|nr:adenosylcobinamide-GDP ribazoletransferase [Lachnospiraceae bacterium]